MDNSSAVEIIERSKRLEAKSDFIFYRIAAPMILLGLWDAALFLVLKFVYKVPVPRPFAFSATASLTICGSIISFISLVMNSIAFFKRNKAEDVIFNAAREWPHTEKPEEA